MFAFVPLLLVGEGLGWSRNTNDLGGVGDPATGGATGRTTPLISSPIDYMAVPAGAKPVVTRGFPGVLWGPGAQYYFL